MPLPEIKLGTLTWPACPPKARRVSPWGHKSIVLLFFLLLGNRFLSQQNESRIAMTDTRDGRTDGPTYAIPLFRFHFGRNNCLEPLERAAVAMLPPNGSRNTVGAGFSDNNPYQIQP